MRLPAQATVNVVMREVCNHFARFRWPFCAVLPELCEELPVEMFAKSKYVAKPGRRNAVVEEFVVFVGASQ